MLRQRHVVQQHASDPVNVGGTSESSVGGHLQPVTVHSAGAAGMLRDSQWYDCACLCLLNVTVIFTFATSVCDLLTERRWSCYVCICSEQCH